MRTPARPLLTGPLPRRDIVAICVYLNRRNHKAVDACVAGPESILEKLAAAARMQ